MLIEVVLLPTVVDNVLTSVEMLVIDVSVAVTRVDTPLTALAFAVMFVFAVPKLLDNAVMSPA